MLTSYRILVILPFFYPHRGGSQKYVEDLYATMIATFPNVSVDVLCYNTLNQPSTEKYRGLNIIRIPCWTLIADRFVIPHPGALLSQLRELSKTKYDIVNTHVQFFDPTWWGWWWAKKVHAHSIFTGHSSSHPAYQNKLVSAVAWLVDQTLARLTVPRYDTITVENADAADFFSTTYHIKTPHIVYGGINSNVYRRNPDRTTRVIPTTDHSITADKILVTYAGRLIKTKGVEYFYQAIKQMPLEIRNKAIFVIAGPGELEEQLRTMVKEDTLGGSVFVTGSLNYDQVRELLSNTDIFVLPTHHNEGLPIVILEAAASECAIITTNTGGIGEVVQHDHSGILIPQRDSTALEKAISTLILNGSKRDALGQVARQLVVANHEQTTISTQFYHLIEQLIQR